MRPHYVLPPLTPCRAIVTIHDCIHLRFPQYLPNRMAYVYARAQLWSATRRARRVLTVSQASKQDIVRFFDVPESKVTVIPNAIDERFRQTPADADLVRVRERYQLPERFIMYAGNVKPHKNLERLIDAFVTVRARGVGNLGLLLSGSEVSQHATLRRAVHRYNLHKHVRFLGYQTTETLAVPLSGWPICSSFRPCTKGSACRPWRPSPAALRSSPPTCPSLPEVLGDAAVLVDPLDAEAIADGITRVLEDADLRADLHRKGLERASQFSWEQSVKRIRHIYEEIEDEN